MAGFDENDPLSDGQFGYRADVLRNGAIKSYNGFVFPPAIRSRITVVPEYTDDNITTKYLTIALNIEFILTDGDVDQITDFNEESYISSTFANTMMRKLSQPGQALHFTHDVLGDFKVNAVGGTIYDIDYGPKPQVIEIEPLGGGNAARVEWLCVTRVSPCITSQYSNAFIQFSYSTSWGLDPSGYMIRTIEGSFEIASSRTPVTGSDHANTTIRNPIAEIQNIKSYLLKQFPLLTGFRRQIFYRLKTNRKTLEFKFEDTENRSDNKFPPGVSDIELTQSVTSSFEEGFLVWKLTYAGRLETVNGKSVTNNFYAKKLAFYWLGIIIQQKRKLFEQIIGTKASSIGSKQPFPNGGSEDSSKPSVWPEVVRTQTSGPTGQTITETYQPQTEQHEFMIIPSYLSISDSLYSNSIQFTVGYKAWITTELLTQAIGLFEPLQAPGLENNTWVKYLDTAQVYKESVNLMPDSYPVVDLCHPLTAGPSNVKEEATNRTQTIGQSLTEVTYNESASNWMDYHNEFIYYNSSMNVIGTHLSTENLRTEDQDVPIATPKQVEEENDGTPYTSGNAENVVEQPHVRAFSPSKAVAYIKMVGYASRVGKPIQAPNLKGVGDGIWIDQQGNVQINRAKKGALANKYGEDIIAKTTEKTGLNKAGRPVYIHKTSWEKMYVLDAIPTSGKITTTGVPGRHK